MVGPGTEDSQEEVVDRTGFGGHPVGTEALGQQVARLVVGQQIQRQRVGTFGRDQVHLRVKTGRDPLARDRQSAQESPHRLGRIQHRVGRLAGEQCVNGRRKRMMVVNRSSARRYRT
jgi:hypothetical protein